MGIHLISSTTYYPSFWNTKLMLISAVTIIVLVCILIFWQDIFHSSSCQFLSLNFTHQYLHLEHLLTKDRSGHELHFFVAGAGAMLDNYGNGNKFTQWHMEDTNAFASGRLILLMTMTRLMRDSTKSSSIIWYEQLYSLQCRPLLWIGKLNNTISWQRINYISNSSNFQTIFKSFHISHRRSILLGSLIHNIRWWSCLFCNFEESSFESLSKSLSASIYWCRSSHRRICTTRISICFGSTIS